MVSVKDLPQYACCSWKNGTPECNTDARKAGICHQKREIEMLAQPDGAKLWMAQYRDKCASSAKHGGCIPPASVTQKMLAAGIPANIVSRVQEPKSTPALEVARKWFDERPKPSLAFSGATGAGKSFAAAWCAYRWGLRFEWNSGATGSSQRPLVWVRAWDISHVDNWHDEHALEILDNASKAYFLVVDDIGKEASKGGATALSDLLCYRLDNGKATIITTNQPGSVFKSTYGEHLADRIKANAVTFSAISESERHVA